MSKRERHRAILDVVREHPVGSQEALRARLARRGFRVAQATLSRDLRELGLVKRPTPRGGTRWEPDGKGQPVPALARLLPDLFTSAEGTGNLIVLRTRAGGAQPVAAAIDAEGWPEVLGTIAGDDTILLVLRRARDRAAVRRRLEGLAAGA